MRSPIEKTTTVVPPSNTAYCVNDAQNTTTLFYLTTTSKIGIQHIAALEDLFQTMDRFDRLHFIVQEMATEQMVENYGVWPHELSDLEDLMCLFRFLSACHRRPTTKELEGVLKH